MCNLTIYIYAVHEKFIAIRYIFTSIIVGRVCEKTLLHYVYVMYIYSIYKIIDIEASTRCQDF